MKERTEDAIIFFVKFYFVCSLGAMILKQTHPDRTLFATEGLELKES